MTWNSESIILNEVVEKKGHVINFICLMTKQFIYRQKCLGQRPIFSHLKAIIRRTGQIEKYIAIKNKKLSVHIYKWGKDARIHNEDTIQNYILEYLGHS